jgi:hypothetical protein
MLWPYVTLQSSLMEFANSLMNSCVADLSCMLVLRHKAAERKMNKTIKIKPSTCISTK